jgi:nicotinamidase/pyrazinamidase
MSTDVATAADTSSKGGAEALIVVDMQNDFADPKGSLYVNGADRVIANVNREILKATAEGRFVVYTQDWHPETTPHFQKDGGVWPVHCVAESWGADFHPRVVVAGPSVHKGVDGNDGYSGFTTRDPQTGEQSSTELHDLLRERGVSSVRVCGLALDYCVKETAADAVRLGYDVTVVTDATAPVEVNPGDGEAAAEELAAAGVELAA